ncbi:MAG: nuclear transport factor 2 family protein [Chakrabartia sp.]
MTTEALWTRYSAIWSAPEKARAVELAACLSSDATYCDPNGLVEGPAALSAYMGGFQESAPGCSFRIKTVLEHNGRTLATWSMIGPDESVLQDGTSFGQLSDDGRLHAITGFFYDRE